MSLGGCAGSGGGSQSGSGGFSSIGALGGFIGIIALGIFGSKKADRPEPQEVQATNYDRSLPVPLCYGTDKFAGTCFYIGRTGVDYITLGGKGTAILFSSMLGSLGGGSASGEMMVYLAEFAIAFGEGPLKGISDIFVADESLSNPDEYDLTYRIYLGLTNQTIDPDVQSFLATKAAPGIPWKNTGYLYLNGPIGTGNYIPEVKAEVAGLLAFGSYDIAFDWINFPEPWQTQSKAEWAICAWGIAYCNDADVGIDSEKLMWIICAQDANDGKNYWAGYEIDVFNYTSTQIWKQPVIGYDGGGNVIYTGTTRWSHSAFERGFLVAYTTGTVQEIIKIELMGGGLDYLACPRPGILYSAYVNAGNNGGHGTEGIVFYQGIMYLYGSSGYYPRIYKIDWNFWDIPLTMDLSLVPDAYKQTCYYNAYPRFYPLIGGTNGIDNGLHFQKTGLWKMVLADNTKISILNIIGNAFGFVADMPDPTYVPTDAAYINNKMYIACYKNNGTSPTAFCVRIYILDSDGNFTIAADSDYIATTGDPAYAVTMRYSNGTMFIFLYYSSPSSYYMRKVFRWNTIGNRIELVDPAPGDYSAYFKPDSCDVYKNNIVIFCNPLDFHYWKVGAVQSGVGKDANPIEVCYDFMTNARYGLGLSVDLFDGSPLVDDSGSWRTEYLYCEEFVTVVEANSTYEEARFAFSKAYINRQKGFDIIRDILSTCRAFIYYCNGKIAVHIEKPTEEPVFYFGLDEQTYIVTG